MLGCARFRYPASWCIHCGLQAFCDRKQDASIVIARSGTTTSMTTATAFAVQTTCAATAATTVTATAATTTNNDHNIQDGLRTIRQ